MAVHPFGKFPSISVFLDAIEAERQEQAEAAEQGMSLAARRAHRRKQQQSRNIVEVSGVIRVREADDTDGDRHHRLLLTLTEILMTDPDVDDDLQARLEDEADVFVAIRFGDRMGILKPVPRLEEKAQLHLRGEWVTADNAQAHGGEKLSVLHFTHHPIGFVCIVNPDRCFS